MLWLRGGGLREREAVEGRPLVACGDSSVRWGGGSGGEGRVVLEATTVVL